MSAGIPVVGAGEIRGALTRAEAVAAIERALAAGQDVEADTPRLFRPLRAGEFLLMPAESPAHAGVKVATVAPGNPARGIPKIHAWYLLFDAGTLRPVALLDGTELTTLRTPAVTAAAIRGLLRAAPGGPRERIDRLAVFGSGPQAEAHVRTLHEIFPVERVSILGRTPERVEALLGRLRADGIAAEAGDAAAVAAADVVVTATSSSAPVLALGDVRSDAVVAAIGAHGPAHRELAADLVRGSDLVVEARASAFRESGNLLQARAEADWTGGAQAVANVRELVAGAVRRTPGRPAVFAGVGMSWEDLAIAEHLLDVLGLSGAPGPEEETP
ncbi:ornithine cyclodeaminase family protein [Microbacterium excoecariae]|uniref:ornithine cyclodeaminase family protein n=1 Tax=Microbacterium excoecariae TaxID=2715210 RepID=UPI00197B5E3E